MKRKIMAIALAAIMVCSMAACGSGGDGQGSGSAGADGETIILKIGSTVQDTSAGGRAMLEVFKPNVEKYSDGKIKVEVYNNSVLGGDRQLLEALQINTVQMAAVPLAVLANFDSKFTAAELPFLFKDKQAAYDALDGEFGELMAKDIESQGMVLTAYTENSFRNISNSKKPIEKLEDLKGLKIRVMESPMYLSMFKKLGANPTPMTFNELYTGLQQGTVEGQDNGIVLTYTAKFYEVQKYYTLLGQNYAAGAFMISKGFYESLSPELQDAIIKAAEDTRDAQREWNATEEEEDLKIMQDAGLQVNTMSDEEKARIKDVLVPAVWDECKKDIGDELYQMVTEISADSES